MLWNAGQKRIYREGRDRLAELFVAARDAAVDVLVTTGQAKPKGTWRRPSYIESEAPRPRTTADRDATLAKIGAMFPDAVRRIQ
jgi:hypothetical protein